MTTKVGWVMANEAMYNARASLGPVAAQWQSFGNEEVPGSHGATPDRGHPRALRPGAVLLRSPHVVPPLAALQRVRRLLHGVSRDSGPYGNRLSLDRFFLGWRPRGGSWICAHVVVPLVCRSGAHGGRIG